LSGPSQRAEILPLFLWTGIIGHCSFVTGMLNAFEMMPAPGAEKLPA